MNWTPEAERTLAEYFERNTAQLGTEGADRTEVEGDIRRHIDEELRAKGVNVVTAESLRKILRGFSEEQEAEPADYQPPRPRFMAEPVPSSLKPLRIVGKMSFCFFAIILPAGTLVLEAITGFCGGVFFDPIPSVWHLALVALVPLTNLFLYRALNESMPARPQRLLVLGGASIVIAGYYTLLFLPLYPYACIGILAYGMGFLPMASGTALVGTLIATSRLQRRLRKRQRGEAAQEGRPLSSAPVPLWRRPMAIGLTCGIVAMGVLEIPKYLGRAGLRMAVSEKPGTSRAGLALLRSFGSEATVLRACYEPNRRFQRLTDTAGWVFGLLEPVGTDKARETYYQMTGNAFNAVAPPKMHSRYNRDFWGAFQFDEEQGGTAVGARLAGLRAQSSRLDMHLDPLSSLAYTEWTLVFENLKGVTQEARFEAQLPPSGVVSRLTLWVNGEPQEAAFGIRAKVRAAYQEVAIRQQRDPVLVTTTGPDRILVQCFPVPVNGGTIKIRLGITAPLTPEGDGKGLAWLPHFTERNFSIGNHFEHSVWAQSRQRVDSPVEALVPEKAKNESAFALRGGIPDVDMSGSESHLRVQGVDPDRLVWSSDPLDIAGAESPMILREPAGTTRPAHSHVFVVLDTSAGMESHWSILRDSLAALPADAPITLIAAEDSVAEFSGTGISEAFRSIRPRGGKDNSEALLHALDAARGKPGSAVVWIHSPQPVLIADPELIAQRLERSFEEVPLHDMPLGPGPNRTLDAISAFTRTHAAPRGADAGEFIGSLLRETPEPLAWKYRSIAPGEPIPDNAAEVWDHLARYAAYEKVMATHFGESEEIEASEAPEFAARHQLVTPYTGAVVLETKQQFERAALDQVSANTAPYIPTIPEPATPLLLMLAAMGWMMRRRRR